VTEESYPLIASRQNPKVKQVVRLCDRRDRDREGLFLIEGYRELLRAQQGGQALHTLFVCPALFLGENEPELISRIAEDVPVHLCTPEVFEKLSYRDRPDGLLAIARQQRQGLAQLEPLLNQTDAPFLVVAEAIEKPGNLGTILRSCDAAGVDALILCDACTDVFNPNVVRASVGTLFTVPVFEATTPETIAWLKKNEVSLLAATPHATQLYTEIDLSGPVALAVGTEQLGLSEALMRQSQLQVRIPMLGVADSLNVATATTLLLYEVVRQRGLG